MKEREDRKKLSSLSRYRVIAQTPQFPMSALNQNAAFSFTHISRNSRPLIINLLSNLFTHIKELLLIAHRVNSKVSMQIENHLKCDQERMLQ
jgi:hypothetical protein